MSMYTCKAYNMLFTMCGRSNVSTYRRQLRTLSRQFRTQIAWTVCCNFIANVYFWFTSYANVQ